ncbi:13268_t:CDS:2 [Acaulospora colombiana]|uniref:13268_t:CDS:1 n=1 Tax=Acaulospora colombiana TaxID=27376 RepID=A0ACA9K0W2_9GLOM|nr:13268_t:CDS:2 [Acaulospora colombiana]
MPFGGYTFSASPYNSTTNSNYLTLYAYGDNETQIGSIGPTPINPYSAMCITSNNTLLFAANTSNERNSWTLYNYRLPIVHPVFNGYYSNLEINYTVPEINGTVEPFNATTISITFNVPVEFTNANISIYHSSTGNLRQIVSGTNSDICSISSDSLTITVKVISSVFNQPGEQYYIKMDNNFVKSKDLNEPLKGIESHIWIPTANIIPDEEKFSDGTSGTLYLTINATAAFLNLTGSEKSEYISELLIELTYMVPVRQNRLSSNGNYQHINAGTPFEQIFIAVYVNKPNNNTERSVPGVFSDLNTMISKKQITSISTGSKTNDLDPNFGFNEQSNLWNEYKMQIIGVLIAFSLCVLLFLLARSKKPEENNKIHDNKWFEKNGKIAAIFTIVAAADVQALEVLNSNLGGLDIFNAPFSGDASYKIFIGSCVDIIIRNIPQFIIQSIVTYNIVPLLLLATTFLTLLVNIIGRLYESRHRLRPQYSPPSEEAVSNQSTHKSNEGKKNIDDPEESKNTEELKIEN